MFYLIWFNLTGCRNADFDSERDGRPAREVHPADRARAQAGVRRDPPLGRTRRHLLPAAGVDENGGRERGQGGEKQIIIFSNQNVSNSKIITIHTENLFYSDWFLEAYKKK